MSTADDSPNEEEQTLAPTQSDVDVPEEDEDDLEEGVPAEVLDSLGPEAKDVMSSFSAFAAQMPFVNPIQRRVTPQHITDVIANNADESRRESEAGTSKRRYQAFYVVLAVALVVFIMVFFTMVDDGPSLTTILTALGGFAGGWGVGRATPR